MNSIDMKKVLIKNFKSKLNKSSKWYNEDIEDYTRNLNKTSKERITELYYNSVAFNSKAFDELIEKEEEKLLKGGMYDINKLKPVNCLD